MTTAFWCVLAATVLPYVWSTLSKVGQQYDNALPRAGEYGGWQRRANWAQQNAWEAFAPFAAAVLIAHWLKTPQSTVDLLALLFIGFRIAHGIAYVADYPKSRSLMWVGGIGCVIALYVVAARAA